MVKEGCFLPLKTRKAHEIKGFEHLTKHRLRRYEALAKLVWCVCFANMKRSAPPRPHVAKPHFIGRSPASFFMHRRCASLKKALAFASAFFWAHSTKIQLVKSRRSRVWNPQLVCSMESRQSLVWNQHEVLNVINPKKDTRWRVMPYAFGDYILTCGEITCQSFGLDRKKTAWKRSFFLPKSDPKVRKVG